MSRHLTLLLLFISFNACVSQTMGKESRFIITYLFPANGSDECEVLWITDAVEDGSTEFTLWPIDYGGVAYVYADDQDSTSDAVAGYNKLRSINSQNRILTQVFTKTWAQINLHRSTDYGSVFICPVKGDFAPHRLGSVDAVSCNNVSYDEDLWHSKLAQILKTTDFSKFDFLRYSLFRLQQPVFEPIRPTDVADTAIVEGNFWLFEFQRRPCCDAGEYEAFVVPADSVRPPNFALTPLLMDDTFVCRLDDKNLMANSRLIQVYTKTWAQCNGKFEHVLVMAIPLHGKFKPIVVADGMSATPIYLPVGEYTIAKEMWDSYGEAAINFVDYSNFDYRVDDTIIDDALYDDLDYPCPH